MFRDCVLSALFHKENNLAIRVDLALRLNYVSNKNSTNNTSKCYSSMKQRLLYMSSTHPLPGECGLVLWRGQLQETVDGHVLIEMIHLIHRLDHILLHIREHLCDLCKVCFVVLWWWHRWKLRLLLGNNQSSRWILLPT